MQRRGYTASTSAMSRYGITVIAFFIIRLIVVRSESIYQETVRTVLLIATYNRSLIHTKIIHFTMDQIVSTFQIFLIAMSRSVCQFPHENVSVHPFGSTSALP